MSSHSSISSDSSDSAELMYVKCASCGKWMDVKPGHINNISHSLCPECYRQEMGKLDQLPKPPDNPAPTT